jgi:hypothetical protein
VIHEVSLSRPQSFTEPMQWHDAFYFVCVSMSTGASNLCY